MNLLSNLSDKPLLTSASLLMRELSINGFYDTPFTAPVANKVFSLSVIIKTYLLYIVLFTFLEAIIVII